MLIFIIANTNVIELVRGDRRKKLGMKFVNIQGNISNHMILVIMTLYIIIDAEDWAQTLRTAIENRIKEMKETQTRMEAIFPLHNSNYNIFTETADIIE
jgi:hypothetical protein